MFLFSEENAPGARDQGLEVPPRPGAYLNGRCIGGPLFNLWQLLSRIALGPAYDPGRRLAPACPGGPGGWVAILWLAHRAFLFDTA